MQSFARPISETRYFGYNDTDPSEMLPHGVFSKAENAYVSDNKITKVPGSSAIATAIASRNINGLVSYEKISSSSKNIIALVNGASNAQLYKWGGSGAFSAIGSANLTNNKTMRFETANDSLFGFDGTEVIDYDGTTVTKNRAGIPLAYYPAWFHNYLFALKTDANPNRVSWSDLGNPISFTSTNFVDINPGDSDQIMGPGKLQDELFIFKQNTIWSITGWSGASFNSTTINTQNTNNRIVGYGCVAPDSIVSVGNDIYYFSFLGSTPVVRSLRKTQTAATLGGGVVSEDIKGTTDTINQSALTAIVGAFDGRYLMYAVPTGSSTTPNKLLVMDTWNISRIKQVTFYPWTTMVGKNVGRFALSTISGKQIVYFSDTAATGLVFKFDSSLFTDNGSPVVMDVRTRDYMLDPARKSKWKYIYVKYDTTSAGTLNVNARVDQAVNFGLQEAISLKGNSPGLGPTGTFTLGVSVLGGSMTTKNRVTFAHLTGTMLGIQFSESTSNGCTIYEHEIYGKPKGLRDD